MQAVRVLMRSLKCISFCVFWSQKTYAFATLFLLSDHWHIENRFFIRILMILALGSLLTPLLCRKSVVENGLFVLLETWRAAHLSLSPASPLEEIQKISSQIHENKVRGRDWTQTWVFFSSRNQLEKRICKKYAFPYVDFAKGQESTPENQLLQSMPKEGAALEMGRTARMVIYLGLKTLQRREIREKKVEEKVLKKAREKWGFFWTQMIKRKFPPSD